MIPINRIYLAARYSRKDEGIELVKKLENCGYTVVSSWTDEPWASDVQLNEVSEKQLKEYCSADIEEMRSADIILSLTEDPHTLTVRGGRHVEFGVGLALNKLMVIIGPKENVFHHHYDVVQFDTQLDALKWLSYIRSDGKRRQNVIPSNYCENTSSPTS